MSRALVMVGSALVAIAARSMTAHACSCAPEIVVASPSDGATSVPINAVIILRSAGPQPVALEDAATHEAVALEQEAHGSEHFQTGNTVFARPTAMLAPNTAYTLTVGDAVHPGFRQTTFTTGDAMDMAPPAFAGLDSLSPETMRYPIPDDEGGYCISSCVTVVDNHISRLRFDFDEPPADVVYLELEVLDANHEPLDQLPLSSTATHVFGFDYCSPRSPILTPGTDYCARLVGYDAAGNTAGQSNEVCATAAACAPRLRNDVLACDPVDECLPDETDDGGCATSGTSDGCAPALALLGLALVIRRRR